MSTAAERVYRPNDQTEIRQLSGSQVLRDRKGELRHIDRISEIAFSLGYPMLLWNGRVYAFNGDLPVDTTLLEEDVI